jgi:hypothetical protein
MKAATGKAAAMIGENTETHMVATKDEGMTNGNIKKSMRMATARLSGSWKRMASTKKSAIAKALTMVGMSKPRAMSQGLHQLKKSPVPLSAFVRQLASSFRQLSFYQL